MLDLTIEVSPGRTYGAFDCELISQGEAVHGVWSIPEDARVSILLETSDRTNELGTPVIYIGDVTYELSLHSSVNGKKTWSLLFEDDQFSGMPFFNYVGRSEIVLAFTKSDLRIKNLVDIQASTINAELADSMLSYLHTHYDSIVALCFSRSRLSCSSGEGCDDSLNRLITEAQSGIELCELVWADLLRKVRENWESSLELKDGAIPNSPDGISWLSQHPEYIQFCSQSEQDFKCRGYPAKILQGANEVIVSNTDLVENKIIHGYLAHLEKRLFDATKYLLEYGLDGTHGQEEASSFDEYVSLDHVLSKYKAPILDGLLKKVSDLSLRTKRLALRFAKVSPKPKVIKPIPPKVTAFVSRTPSYLQVYQKIAKWYQVGNVKIDMGDMLFGLRHLSTLYEFTVLMQIVTALEKCGSVLVKQSWRDYSEPVFGGVEKTRPTNALNNYFEFNDLQRNINIELFYEPRIWTSKRAQPGDPVDVCIEHQDRNCRYRSPDYVIRLRLKGIEEPILLIFDAKFSSAYRVRTQKLPDLVNKYLLGIHQKKVDGGFGKLPIQAVWAIYPKGNDPKVNFYARQHSIGGRESILPSLGGIRIKPNEDESLPLLLGQLFDHVVNEHQDKSVLLEKNTFSKLHSSA
ncbi:nuclease domain-containing protein [Photobacterium leiognathi]|uniref:nuclease domain-containing protein n=1 Tax=Photobacterium leiognathi TaxID=553611 RepID=UPI00298195DF|nr:nuclease domain-containing protein [Photobacterium leiognathi]